MKDIKIIVATHKKYRMPDDKLYLPLYVGAEGKESIGYIGDNTGDNISDKNPSFCELTGLYWAWKNLDFEYIGLAHYRRHFKGKKKDKDVFKNIISYEEIDKLLDETDIIVTKKRKYYIENIYDHYAHTLHIETLDEARKIISKKYPEYIPSFDSCMKHTYMHAFNMFVMKRNLLNDYCNWLFDILFELEKNLKNNQYNSFHARYPGRVSELLLDVWLDKNKLEYKEIPFIYMEKINMLNKGCSFLAAKFFNKKYGESF